MCTRICPSLSAAHQHRCSSVFQAGASAPPFFISLGRQNGQAQLYFHQGKVRITHHSSGRGSLNFSQCGRSGRRRGRWTALLQHHCPHHGAGILALSLRADFQQQQQEPTGVSVTGGTSPSAPGSTVSFPVLAAKGTSNTSAYRTLLGHNSLHDLIILIGINWKNNSLFQQE